MIRVFTVQTPGLRLDRYLVDVQPEFSRSQAQRLIADGLVAVNDTPSKASCKVRSGDRVAVTILPPAPPALAPEPMPLQVVYEDSDLVVINKPAGLVVHPAPGHPAGTLVNALLAHCPDLSGIGGVERPGIVHRLDKDTSGLIVVAKNQHAHNSLTRQIKDRAVTKCYLALVHGEPRPAQGVINAPMGRDPRHRQRMAVVAGGREAVTHYRTLERLGACTLLEVQIQTGRTHQIRVHLSFLGYPVVGDAVYGRKRKGSGGTGETLQRQFLHAYRLGLKLPSSGEYREFRVELPGDLQQVVAALREHPS
jgi:23S rRNA pseudouridine1911/1915/1917 synthase